MCSIMKAPQQVLQQGLCFSCKEFKHVSTFNLQPSHFPLAETETQLAWNPKSDCCCILWTPRWASAWTNTFLLIFLLLLHLNLHHPPLLLLYALLQTPARAPLKVLMKAAGQRRGADTEPERRREEDSLHFKNLFRLLWNERHSQTCFFALTFKDQIQQRLQKRHNQQSDIQPSE